MWALMVNVLDDDDGPLSASEHGSQSWSAVRTLRAWAALGI